MRIIFLLPIVFIFFQSCFPAYSKIDLKEAHQLVSLDSLDLMYFSELRQQLLHDSAVIRIQDEKVNPHLTGYKWITVNSYYLNQIDSSSYKNLYYRLQGKMEDHIELNRNGSVIFRLKHRTQMNTGKDNETYSHDLITANCNCAINTVYNKVDTIYVDSVINKEWRYTFYKVLTGW